MFKNTLQKRKIQWAFSFLQKKRAGKRFKLSETGNRSHGYILIEILNGILFADLVAFKELGKIDLRQIFSIFLVFRALYH